MSDWAKSFTPRWRITLGEQHCLFAIPHVAQINKNTHIQLGSSAFSLSSSFSFTSFFPKTSGFFLFFFLTRSLWLLHFFHAPGCYYSTVAGLMFTWLQPCHPGGELEIAWNSLAQQLWPVEKKRTPTDTNTDKYCCESLLSSHPALCASSWAHSSLSELWFTLTELPLTVTSFHASPFCLNYLWCPGFLQCLSRPPFDFCWLSLLPGPRYTSLEGRMVSALCGHGFPSPPSLSMKRLSLPPFTPSLPPPHVPPLLTTSLCGSLLSSRGTTATEPQPQTMSAMQ